MTLTLTKPRTNSMKSFYGSSQPEPTETELAQALWKIVRNPKLPTKPLPESGLSQRQHDALLHQWSQIISNKNDRGNRAGLSLDDFWRLINSFYGKLTEDRPINRSAIHRLIQTGNPAIKGYARSLNTEMLRYLSEFSHDLSYAELEEIGNRVLRECKSDVHPRYGRKGAGAKSDQNALIRDLVMSHIEQYGYESLTSKGVAERDILEILFEAEPKVNLRILVALPSVLGMSNDEFLQLTDPDYDDNQG